MNTRSGNTLSRRAAAVMVLLVNVCVVALLPTTASAAPAPNPAADNYGGCLANERSGDLLVLIDQSGSLGTSDPNAARVDAASYLVSRLNDYATQRKIDLQVAVAGFDVDYHMPAVPWTPLSDSTLGSVTTGIAGFRDLTRGEETDYWSALEGARRELGSRATGPAPRRCQAIAWFSDGKLDIVPRATADDQQRLGATKPYSGGLQITSEQAADQAESDARASICRSGGLADGLRSADIPIFAVGLTAPGGADPADFGLMRAIATGTPDGAGPCGAITEPAPGSFQTASDLDGLLQAFNSFPDPGQTQQTPICQVPAAQCTDRHQFVLDSSIQTVNVLGTLDRDGVQADLTLPDGSVVALPTGAPGQTATTGGVTITWTWLTPRTVEAKLSRVDGAPLWAGVWGLSFTDPAARSAGGMSTSTIKIWSDLQPALLGADTVRLTSDSVVPNVRIGLVRADDPSSTVDPTTLLGTVRVSGVLLSSDRTQKIVVPGLDQRGLADPVSLDLTGVAPGTATLRLTLELTTADATVAPGVSVPGTALLPQQADVGVEILPPANYPTVQGPVDFGIADNSATVTARLPFTGPGCVWLDPADPVSFSASPDKGVSATVGATTATAGASCVTAPEGQRGNLDLRLTTDQVANGAVAGTIMVSIAPLDQPDQRRTVPVAFAADLRAPLGVLPFLLGLVLALILGPGIPLALLYALKRYNARIPSRSLAMREVAVTVEGHQVLRDGAPFALRPDDFVQLAPVPPGGARNLPSPSGVPLRTRVGWSPFGAGWVSVDPPAPVVAAGFRTPASHGKTLRGRLPLAVHNSWVVLHDPQGPVGRAVVLMLVGGDTMAEQRRDLGLDVASRLPDVLAQLRREAQARGLTGPSAPGPGPSYGPQGGADPFGAGPPPSAPGSGPQPGGFGDPFGASAPHHETRPIPGPWPSGRADGGREQRPAPSQAGDPGAQPTTRTPYAGASPTVPTPLGPRPPGGPGDPFGTRPNGGPADPFGREAPAEDPDADRYQPGDPFGPGPGQR